jgi:FkbM family methyltransferase
MLIFDVGAHRGEDTEFYLSKGFSVVAVEASPKLAALLKQKFEGESRVKVVHAAIADVPGEVTFYECEWSVWGTVNKDWKRRNELLGASSQPVTVPAVRFEELLNCYGIPHYLKIDI